MNTKSTYRIGNKDDMNYIREQYEEGTMIFLEDIEASQPGVEHSAMEKENKVGNGIQNEGWKSLAEKLEADYNMRFFEQRFNVWQKQGILLTEISHAETYTYVTPIGVYTHIGTLARALQYIFEEDWDIHVTLMGTELSFRVNKGIAGVSHTLKCTFLELDQAFSDMHHEGWKLDKNNNRELAVPKEALLPMASCMVDLVQDSLEDNDEAHFYANRAARVEKRTDGLYVLSLVDKEG